MSLDGGGRSAERVARPLLLRLWQQVERAGEVARRVLTNEPVTPGPKHQLPVDQAAVKTVRNGQVPGVSPELKQANGPANAD